MSITENNVKATISRNLTKSLHYSDVSIHSGMDAEEIKEALRSAIDDTVLTYEVIYLHEAWDIVAGGEFNEYEPEQLDFSGCERSTDAVMKEAQAIIDAHLGAWIDEILESMADRFSEICETVEKYGSYIDMTLSSGDVYGWNAHSYETSEGTCVHKGLEGEPDLFAVVGSYDDCYLSASFTKERDCE